MTLLARLGIGALLATAVGFAGVRARALTIRGAVAAAATGMVAVAAGWEWAAFLISYFVAAMLLSRLGRSTKRTRTGGVIEKGGARDATQVAANGGAFALCLMLSHQWSYTGPWVGAAVGALAASSADTWATEIGTLIGQTPRSILNWRPVAVGMSGGLTIAGSTGGILGAVFIAAIARALALPVDLASIVLAGIGGAAADSLLGATVQRRQWCGSCQRVTEMHVHDCGTMTTRIGGVSWIENDMVNLLATIVGSLIAYNLPTMGIAL